MSGMESAHSIHAGADKLPSSAPPRPIPSRSIMAPIMENNQTLDHDDPGREPVECSAEERAFSSGTQQLFDNEEASRLQNCNGVSTVMGLSRHSRSPQKPHPLLVMSECDSSFESEHTDDNTYANTNSTDYGYSDDERNRQSQCVVDEHGFPKVEYSSFIARETKSHHPRYETEGMKCSGPWIWGNFIGSGTSGAVYLVKHEMSGEIAALKVVTKLKQAFRVVYSDMLGNRRTRGSMPLNQIEKEIASLKVASGHPHIVSLIDLWEDDHNLYVITEYCPHGDLYGVSKGHRRLPEDTAVGLFREIISGIAYVHQLRLCHRDLKLENVLLGSDLEAKIADFGLATPSTKYVKLTSLCGSAHYCAPELVNNCDYDGAMVDSWACGVLLYNLLTGLLPFNHYNMVTLVDMIKVGKFDMPNYLSDNAKDLLSRLLEYEPSKRLRIDGVNKHPWILDYVERMRDSGKPLAKVSNSISGVKGADKPVVRAKSDLRPRTWRAIKLLWPNYSDQKIFNYLRLKSVNAIKIQYILLEQWERKHAKKRQHWTYGITRYSPNYPSEYDISKFWNEGVQAREILLQKEEAETANTLGQPTAPEMELEVPGCLESGKKILESTNRLVVRHSPGPDHDKGEDNAQTVKAFGKPLSPNVRRIRRMPSFQDVRAKASEITAARELPNQGQMENQVPAHEIQDGLLNLGSITNEPANILHAKMMSGETNNTDMHTPKLVVQVADKVSHEAIKPMTQADIVIGEGGRCNGGEVNASPGNESQTSSSSTAATFGSVGSRQGTNIHFDAKNPPTPTSSSSRSESIISIPESLPAPDRSRKNIALVARMASVNRKGIRRSVPRVRPLARNASNATTSTTATLKRLQRYPRPTMYNQRAVFQGKKPARLPNKQLPLPQSEKPVKYKRSILQLFKPTRNDGEGKAEKDAKKKKKAAKSKFPSKLKKMAKGLKQFFKGSSASEGHPVVADEVAAVPNLDREPTKAELNTSPPTACVKCGRLKYSPKIESSASGDEPTPAAPQTQGLHLLYLTIPASRAIDLIISECATWDRPKPLVAFAVEIPFIYLCVQIAQNTMAEITAEIRITSNESCAVRFTHSHPTIEGVTLVYWLLEESFRIRGITEERLGEMVAMSRVFGVNNSIGPVY